MEMDEVQVVPTLMDNLTPELLPESEENMIEEVCKKNLNFIKFPKFQVKHRLLWVNIFIPLGFCP